MLQPRRQGTSRRTLQPLATALALAALRRTASLPQQQRCPSQVG